MTFPVFFKAQTVKKKPELKIDPDEAKDSMASDLKDLIAPQDKEAADMATFAQLLGVLQGMNAGGKFGKHNVKPDDHVTFAAGEFKGAGHVAALGEHGATVKDSSAREHRIHWHEITGHMPAKKSADDKP